MRRSIRYPDAGTLSKAQPVRQRERRGLFADGLLSIGAGYVVIDVDAVTWLKLPDVFSCRFDDSCRIKARRVRQWRLLCICTRADVSIDRIHSCGFYANYNLCRARFGIWNILNFHYGRRPEVMHTYRFHEILSITLLKRR